MGTQKELLYRVWRGFVPCHADSSPVQLLHALLADIVWMPAINAAGLDRLKNLYLRAHSARNAAQ